MAAQPQTEIAHWIGSIKTIGKYGPMYEVLGPAGRSANGEELVSIRVVPTGEVTDYEFEDMMNDPEAA
jgi:hypothetical protein